MNNYDNNVVTLSNGVKGKVPRYIHEKLYNKSKTRDKITRHHEDETEEKKKIDKYLSGLYKHIKTESDKKKAAEEKFYKKDIDKVKLQQAIDSLDVKKIKKRD